MEKLVVDFQYDFAFRGVKFADFTNYLKDEKKYIELNIYILHNIINNVCDYSIETLRCTGGYHTHKINDDDKRQLIIKIMKKIFIEHYCCDSVKATEYIKQYELESRNLWQVSCPGKYDIRLIGYLEGENRFKILFIDYHHLIYPNKYYNGEDVDSYNFCPLKFIRVGE